MFWLSRASHWLGGQSSCLVASCASICYGKYKNVIMFSIFLVKPTLHHVIQPPNPFFAVLHWYILFLSRWTVCTRSLCKIILRNFPTLYFQFFYSILLLLGTSFKVEFKWFAPHCILILVTFHAAFKLQLSTSLIFGPLISITHCTDTEKCNEERRKWLHDLKLFLDKRHIIWKQAHQVSGMGATATFCFASVIASWFQRSQLKESRMNI